MKKCKSCQTDIDDKAKKCPNCKSDQRNWFVRHKILTVFLAIIVLAILGSALGGGTDSSSSSQTNTASKETEKETPKELAKIGAPVRDGKFEFVVKSIQCGVPNVGESFTTKTAQGQYCLLTVSVKNIGDVPQSLFSGNQFLYNAENQKYSADDSATFSVANSTTTWYSDINPGNSVEGVIVFDLPKDKVPVTAELHDSIASNGVKVSLQ